MIIIKTLALVTAIAFAACGTSPAPALVWPTVASCIGDATQGALAQASSILHAGAPNYGAQLESLAIERGTNAVACAVGQLIQRWSAPSIMTSETNAAATDRGRAFLAAHGVKATTP